MEKEEEEEAFHYPEEEDILEHLCSSNPQRAHTVLPAETQTLPLDLSCRRPQEAEGYFLLHESQMTRKSIILPMDYLHFSVSDLNAFKDFIFMWQLLRRNQKQIL